MIFLAEIGEILTWKRLQKVFFVPIDRDNPENIWNSFNERS